MADKISIRYCEFCRKEFERKSERGRNARFCSVKCRDRYHNTLKKLPTLTVNILHEFSFILDSMSASGELAESAINSMQMLTNLVLSTQYQIACEHCGQTRLNLPQKGENCHFCNQSRWKVVVIARNKK